MDALFLVTAAHKAAQQNPAAAAAAVPLTPNTSGLVLPSSWVNAGRFANVLERWLPRMLLLLPKKIYTASPPVHLPPCAAEQLCESGQVCKCLGALVAQDGQDLSHDRQQLGWRELAHGCADVAVAGEGATDLKGLRSSSSSSGSSSSSSGSTRRLVVCRVAA